MMQDFKLHIAEALKSNLCDYKDTSILEGGYVITEAHIHVTEAAFKNCAPSTKCITKIDAEDLDLVTPMYNLLEYSSNYFNTTGNLWVCSKDEANNFNATITNNDDFKSFEFKAKIIENTVANRNNSVLINRTIAVLLKYLSNFLEVA